MSRKAFCFTVAKLPEFRYDASQSFRAWLRTVTRNILSDYLAERKSLQGSGDSVIVRLLDNLQAREGLAQEVEAEFDRELLDAALLRTRLRVPTQQWEAFRLTALEGLSGAQSAAELGMLVATVYTAKSKVQKLFAKKFAGLKTHRDVTAPADFSGRFSAPEPYRRSRLCVAGRSDMRERLSRRENLLSLLAETLPLPGAAHVETHVEHRTGARNLEHLTEDSLLIPIEPAPASSGAASWRARSTVHMPRNSLGADSQTSDVEGTRAAVARFPVRTDRIPGPPLPL